LRRRHGVPLRDLREARGRAEGRAAGHHLRRRFHLQHRAHEDGPEVARRGGQVRGAAGPEPELAAARRGQPRRAPGARGLRRAAGPVRARRGGPGAGAVRQMIELAQIKAELEAAPLEAPYPPELAVAVVADVLRDASLAPPAAADFAALLATGTTPANRPGQLSVLARALALTSMRAATVAALRGRS